MAFRTWVALVSVAAAILVFCFAILGANMDPEGRPYRHAAGSFARPAPALPETGPAR